MIPEPIPPEPRKPNWFFPSDVTEVFTEWEKKEEQRKEDELFLTAFSALPIEKRIQLEQEERDYISNVLNTGRLTKVKTQIGSTFNREPIFNSGITEMTATDFSAWRKENTPIELRYNLTYGEIHDIGERLGSPPLDKGWLFDDNLTQTFTGDNAATMSDGSVLMWNPDAGGYIYGPMPYPERAKIAQRTDSGGNARGTLNQPELVQRARTASTMVGTPALWSAFLSSPEALAMGGGATLLDTAGMVTWEDINGSPVTLTKEELVFYIDMEKRGRWSFTPFSSSESEKYSRIDEKMNSYARHLRLPTKIKWNEEIDSARSGSFALTKGSRTDVIKALNTPLSGSYNNLLELKNLLTDNNGPFSKGNMNWDYSSYIRQFFNDPQSYLAAVDPDYTPEKGLEVFRKAHKDNNDLIVYMMAKYS